MKPRPSLTPQHQEFLQQVLANNKALFAGWRMEATEDLDGSEDTDTDDPNGSEDPEVGEDTDDTDGSQEPEDPGFPSGVPVKDMTVDQQTAYYLAQANNLATSNTTMLDQAATAVEALPAEQQALYYKHLARRREGDKNFLQRIIDGQPITQPKPGQDTPSGGTPGGTPPAGPPATSIDEAFKNGERQAIAAMGPKLVEAAFRAELAALPEESRNELIANLSPAFSSYITDSGGVDTEKVTALAKTITSSGKGGGGRQMFGQGIRHDPNRGTQSGIKAGAAMFAASRGKTDPTK